MSRHMGIGKGSQKFVNAGARPQDGACLTPWSTPLSTSVNYHLKFGHSRWSSGKVWLFASRLSRSLKIIGTDTDRSATYDFLLVLRSNYGHISYRFRDKKQLLQNSHVPAEGFPWNFVTALELRKLEW